MQLQCPDRASQEETLGKNTQRCAYCPVMNSVMRNTFLCTVGNPFPLHVNEC